MADIAFSAIGLNQDFGASPQTVPFDTTGATFVAIIPSVISATVEKITGITYDSAAMTGQANNVAGAHLSANQIGLWTMGLGAHAGNHSFVITWTGGGALQYIILAYSGDVTGSIEALLNDGHEDVGTTYAETVTTSTDRSMPVVIMWQGGSNTITAGSGTTKRSTAASNPQIFDSGSVKTPAGAAVLNMNDAANGVYIVVISFAIVAAGGGGGGVTEVQLERATRGVARGAHRGGVCSGPFMSADHMERLRKAA